MIQEKSIQTSDAHEKHSERAKKLLLRLKNEDSSPVQIFGRKAPSPMPE
jgi:hypothetical protein